MGMVAFFTAISNETLTELKADPSLLEALLFPEDGEDPENTTDVDKAWHGIDFILKKMAQAGTPILATAVLGGEPMGEDLGYGPPRLLEPKQVREISEALEAVSSEQFAAAYDARAMSAADVYPNIWERDGQEALDYLVQMFPNLVSFYQGAASRGDGAVLYLA